MIGITILLSYFIVIALFLVTSFFIVYHLASYSIDPELRLITLSLFIIVSGGLLFSSLLLFFSVDWTAILSGITF